MASLKEIKGRIGSVNTTLKTTSAMKLVASAKLRRAQTAIGNMLPYQKTLQTILVNLLDGGNDTGSIYTQASENDSRVAFVCFSSNSSLCGSFNANVIKKATELISIEKNRGAKVTVYSVGRKMADAMKKAGYASPQDYSDLSDKPSYSQAASLATELMEAYTEGRLDRIVLVYNHFKSTASQPTVSETYLPLSLSATAEADSTDYIVEPGREEMVQTLLPKVLMLKIYTVLLDSSAAEHAARTVAMQTATDNGNELLRQLTLEYNKGRQQKITNELLEIESGSLT